jgi:hypothetical protein
MPDETQPKLAPKVPVAVMTLTPFGKSMRALSMYGKGRAFLLAATLLNRSMEGEEHRSEAAEYVVLHLLCQGIETLLKGLLLLRDFDHWHSRLEKPLGHKLLRVGNETLRTYGLRPLRGDVLKELDRLDAMYRRHRLRYASAQDEFIAPASIECQSIWFRVRAVLRLAERELTRANLLSPTAR